MIKTAQRVKTFFILFCIVSGYLLLLCRLAYLQIIQHDFYQAKALIQHGIQRQLPPKRGNILDRNYKDLAISVPVPSVYAVPGKIIDIKKTAKRLADILSLKRSFIEKRLSKKAKFVWIKRKISHQEAKNILREDIPGIDFVEEIKRFYPGNTLLCHVLGFVNIDNKGLAGIEYAFNDQLTGISGEMKTERDAAGRELVLSRKEVKAKDGYNLVLTIDTTIQEIVETELQNTVEEYDALSGTCIVMDPNTGELLALANVPFYDTNHPGDYPEETRRNRAITDIFEPGSTFKPFILSIALTENLVELDDRFFCENGRYNIGGHILHDAHEFDILSAEEIIVHSSNIGIAKIALKIGPEVLYNHLKQLPFGKKTSIDLPGEVSGILRPLNKWSRYSIYSLPMGHEMSLTAIQLITAFASLANDGFIYRPLIVKKITDQQENVIYEAAPELVCKVFPSTATEKTKKALEGVVTPEGTARRAQIPGYRVAGKTGTAQKIDSEGRYSHSKYFSSFIGFLPAEDPRVLISVIINEPKGKHYGGTVAAPAFQRIAYQIMRYIEVAPEEEKSNNE